MSRHPTPLGAPSCMPLPPTPNDSARDEAIPLRRLVLWAIVGVAILIGIVLYFRYQRQIVPMLG